MISIRMTKFFRDFQATMGRTIGTILILVLGGFAVGTMTISMAVIQANMDSGYQDSLPADIILRYPVQSTADSIRMRELILAFPGIEHAERRPHITGRIRKLDGTWKTLFLFLLEDPQNTKVDIVTLETGSIDNNGITMERAAMDYLGVMQNDRIEINLPGIPIKEYPVTATMHAPGLAPSWMEQTVYVFADRSNPLWNVIPIKEDLIRIRTHRLAADDIAHKISIMLEQNGYKDVIREAPDIVRHPHATQMDTLLLMLQSFSLLCVLLSIALGTVQITRMVNSQKRQIALQRAIGSSPGRLWASALFSVAAIALIALCISIPLSIIVGNAYASFALNLLNFNVMTFSLSWWVYAIIFICTIGLPIAAAWFPINRVMRKSIHDGLFNEQVTDTGKIYKPIPIPLSVRIRYAIRTAARKPLRAVLTICILAIGGACFLTAANIQASMDATVQTQFESIKYDSILVLDQNISYEEAAIIENLEPVTNLELWSATYISVKKHDNSWTEKIRLFGIPEDSILKSVPSMDSGTWLSSTAHNSVVINQVAAKYMGNPTVGDNITLQTGSMQKKVFIIGIVTELMSPPLIYINKSADTPGNLIVAKAKKSEFTVQLEHDIEINLPSNVHVQMTMPTSSFKKAVIEHLWIIAAFLIFVSILVLFAGGLSLSSILAIAVRERTREWALLQVLGAGPRGSYFILFWESTGYAILGAILGFLLSIPAGLILSRLFGESFFFAPLVFGISLPGIAGWCLFLLFISITSSLLPALQVIAQPITAGLRYE